MCLKQLSLLLNQPKKKRKHFSLSTTARKRDQLISLKILLKEERRRIIPVLMVFLCKRIQRGIIQKRRRMSLPTLQLQAVQDQPGSESPRQNASDQAVSSENSKGSVSNSGEESAPQNSDTKDKLIPDQNAEDHEPSPKPSLSNDEFKKKLEAVKNKIKSD